MSKDLTTSTLNRQNILNNSFALKKVEKELNLGGIYFQGLPVFTIEQAAHIFEVEKRTIERIINEHNEEITSNGYRILRSSELKEFKGLADVTDINVGDISPKAPQIGVFSFRAFLNLSMLITNSEKAKDIRSKILDVVAKVITEKTGDRTFVNQRDEAYLPAAFQEENYRKEFTSAISRHVKGNQWKYKHCTDAVYKSIFKERATEYRKILNIESKHNVRDTFYAEVLTLIASFESGLPDLLKQKHEDLGRLLTVKEAMNFIDLFGEQKLLKPLVDDVRIKMSSRDYSLRSTIHNKLEAYIQAMPEAEYEKFLGEKSKALEERIEESLEVYKRLRDR